MGAIVYQYGGPPVAFGAIDAGAVGVWPLYEGLDALNLGAHEGKGLLLVAAPFDATVVTSTPGPPFPFGSIDAPVALQFSTQGAAPTIYPAATHGRSSGPADTPAATYVPGRLVGDLSIELSLFGGADPLKAGQGGAGVLELTDPEGELDGLLALDWDGAALELRRGEPAADFSTWSSAAKLTASGLLSGLRSKELRLRDLGWRLERAELHGNRYGGTGGADGISTLAGRLKPYCAGYVFNVTPVQISTALLVWQVSYSSVTAISAVRDAGVALTPGADYATWDLLAAATIAGGTYATCKALGLFRLGSSPAGDVTADVTGDADTIEGQVGPTTRGRIVRRIATAIGAVRFSDVDQIDFAAFQAFESAQPAPVGWYWDGAQPVTKAEAIAEVLAGCLGWWLVRPNGQLAIGQAEDPAALSPTLVLSWPTAALSDSRLGEPQMADTIAPRRATLIGWQRNYTIQARSSLAGSVSDGQAQIFGLPSRYVTQGDQWLANNYPASPIVTLDGGYRDQADAAAEAQRQALLFSTPRRRWSVPVVSMDPLADVVGQRARLDGLGRLGWGASKALLVCGFSTAGGSTVLDFWG